MKHGSRGDLKEIAKKIGSEQSHELDRYTADKSTTELREKISDLIVLRNKKVSHKRLLPLVAVLVATVLLLGSVTIYRLNFSFTDNGTHSTLTPLITNADFRYMIEVPSDYQISEVTRMKTLSRATFVSGDDLIVFTESKTDLSLSVDTENAYTETTGLSSGYERFYIDKNGTTAIWNYRGYYYELYISNAEIDILEIALTLSKI